MGSHFRPPAENTSCPETTRTPRNSIDGIVNYVVKSAGIIVENATREAMEKFVRGELTRQEVNDAIQSVIPFFTVHEAAFNSIASKKGFPHNAERLDGSEQEQPTPERTE